MKRVLGLLLAVAVSAGAALGALRLTVPADKPGDVRRQLTFLRHELDRGAGDDAQANFPEGYFFLYALYGLTEIQLGLGEPPGDRADELREARWALERIDGDKGRAPFDPGLQPAYGIFYRGWANWLRGGVLALRPDPAQRARFASDSAEIAAAFDAAASPFLPAYAGRAWPVDSTVAIASLRLHDARLAGALAGYGDFAGLPVDTPWTRRYAFGVLPIGDAFLAWSKTARPLVAASPTPPPPDVSRWWRLPLLTLLLLIGAAPWIVRLSWRGRWLERLSWRGRWLERLSWRRRR
jgi:hypothetical protein